MLLVIGFIISILLWSTPVSAAEKPTDGYIFLGDSRTVGMDIAVEEELNVYFVAKVGKGYKWLEEIAVQEIEDIRTEHTEISRWTIVTNLGVNDLYNVDKYIELYESLLNDSWSDVRFYVLSVNPVDDTKPQSIKNKAIQDFNEKLYGVGMYINSYDYVLKNMDSRDGIHYSNHLNGELYKKVFDKICVSID